MGVRGYLQLNGVAGAPDLYAALTSARTSQGALRLSLTANCCPAGTHRAGFFVRFRTEPEQQAASPVLSLTTLRRFLSELALPGSAAAGFFVSAPLARPRSAAAAPRPGARHRWRQRGQPAINGGTGCRPGRARQRPLLKAAAQAHRLCRPIHQPWREASVRPGHHESPALLPIRGKGRPSDGNRKLRHAYRQNDGLPVGRESQQRVLVRSPLPIRPKSASPAPAAWGFFVLGLEHRGEHPLPRLGHAVIVVGCRSLSPNDLIGFFHSNLVQAGLLRAEQLPPPYTPFVVVRPTLFDRAGPNSADTPSAELQMPPTERFKD
ncbi:hypothetical protein LNAOJCKE_4533 [Methylorubrum aminovorans]|uniref:Uncharacterized protein n=1 Tax=Methylorubrum aminovorans TaxID=269069 RepID=A0ABQ4UKH3_9HYPH|nr:hypothetical protein LNAOJCKE_4533 [Methylorubrum aminovorans]